MLQEAMPAGDDAQLAAIEPTEDELSLESQAILRRGTWDYMWRRVRDHAAQEHPEFTPDIAYDDNDNQER